MKIKNIYIEEIRERRIAILYQTPITDTIFQQNLSKNGNLELTYLLCSFCNSWWSLYFRFNIHLRDRSKLSFIVTVDSMY
jgi:hypothetical protein